MPAAAPSARAPQYSQAAAKPDNKRKYALFAGAGAAVVVVAVIVFLVLNSGNGGSGGNQTAQTPGNQPTTGHSSTKPSSPSSSAAPADLDRTPSDGKISDYGSAGRLLTDRFYANPAGNWTLLTPAAQQVYGTEQDFQAYWSGKSVPAYRNARADSGGANADGSITINMDINGQSRRPFRIVLVGGQMLIDSNTKLEGPSAGQ
ncbi:hypothetical protein GCM10017567_88090 [Amycolatopsis bullii]|uniref:Serine/threonine protein kinase n=1 Tax=Amycolatopsis bullii TaxID=941987 RepID=A0ABQ3L1A5_9PSEU|nr:hypothetical protein GCM10017567_88090 [Amycolatopsis bullii]